MNKKRKNEEEAGKTWQRIRPTGRRSITISASIFPTRAKVSWSRLLAKGKWQVVTSERRDHLPIICSILTGYIRFPLGP